MGNRPGAFGSWKIRALARGIGPWKELRAVGSGHWPKKEVWAVGSGYWPSRKHENIKADRVHPLNHKLQIVNSNDSPPWSMKHIYGDSHIGLHIIISHIFRQCLLKVLPQNVVQRSNRCVSWLQRLLLRCECLQSVHKRWCNLSFARCLHAFETLSHSCRCTSLSSSEERIVRDTPVTVNRSICCKKKKVAKTTL